ncbi:DUF397 domain-containing protein [Amycolatopsis pigmentata]|uniref:DUF397 domain-containing protein n=1 Tax=Amycolatopsis pigmentata TaxID=450801 RepID=A0ABW5FMW0_9PSEU
MNIEASRTTLATMSGWHKSSYSNVNACVELNGSLPGCVGMRDSKLGADSPILVFERHEMRAFLLAAKDGEFDNLLA